MPVTSPLRHLARALPVALLATAAFAPAANAWHGSLVVSAENSGGDAADTFAFTAKNSPDGSLLAGGTFSLKGGQSKTFANLPAGGESGPTSWKKLLVSQTDDPRYETSIACTIDPVWNGVGKDGSIWSPVYSAAGGEHRATVELRWWDDVAYATRCTATNIRRTAATTLRVVKRFVGAPQGATADLSVDGVVKRAGATSGQGTDPVTVAAGRHSFSETTAVVSDATAACVDAKGAPVENVAQPDGRSWQLDVADGTQVTCTVTNVARGKLTIAEVTDPPSEDEFRPTFQFAGGLGSFALAHGESKTSFVLPGTYAVTAGGPRGWTLTSITCTDSAQGTGASLIDVANRSIVADIQPGEDVTCTFVNHLEDGPVITTTSRKVKAASAVRGASLSGTIDGCVDKTAVARVRGKHVKRVMFYVDGQKVRYLHRRASARYELRHSVAKLAPGVHKVRARIRFTRDSGLKTVSLKLRFTRCA